MIIKISAIILTVIFLLPFGLGLTAGMNRTLKIGIGISIVGLCVIMVTRNLYPQFQFLIPFNDNPQSYRHGFTVRGWLLNGMNLGLIVLVVGILTAYIGSVVQAWRKRQTLLPFLFRSDKEDK